MLAVAMERATWPYRRMTDAPEIVEQKLIGRALAALRIRAGMTQPQAAGAMNITLTAWQNYEAGKRQWKPLLVRRVTSALGSSPEELQLLRDQLADEPEATPRMLGLGFSESRPRAFEVPVAGQLRQGPDGPSLVAANGQEGSINIGDLLGPNARALRLPGEKMIPYAEPGGFVIYQTDRWPRRGQGCVVEMTDGTFQVARYERQDGAGLYVIELHPSPREVRFETRNVRGVYAISLRGD